MLKFYWNGIKDTEGTLPLCSWDREDTTTGKLQLCSYSDGELCNYPGGTITIYGKRYRPFSTGVQQTFTVKDDTETQSDYIVNEHIRVTPEHPLYVEVARALQAMKVHNAKRYAKRDKQAA